MSTQAPRGGEQAPVTIRPAGEPGPALFCVHAAAGDLRLYRTLAEHLPAGPALLGLAAPAPGSLERPSGLEQLAEHHVGTIRRSQPAGPYLILGECTGGALAYEVARQLQAQGETIALLALIDAFAPGFPQLRRLVPGPLYRVLHRIRILAFHAQNLRRAGRTGAIPYVAPRARRAGRSLLRRVSVLLGRPTEEAAGRAHLAAAFADYQPQGYGGAILLLHAASMPFGIEPSPTMGWAGLARQVEVEVVPGYFTTPISEPGVQELAGRLARHLPSPAGPRLEPLPDA